MVEGTPAKVPGHFWPVAAISLLWNAYGGYDYTMTKLRDPGYLKMFPPEMVEWIDKMPVWATAMRAIGVWASLLGSVLLLLRSRHAATTFLVSLVAAAISFAYQHMISLPPALDTGNNWIMTVVILGAITLFWWYSRRMQASGVLR